jgi:hypothetical protein
MTKYKDKEKKPATAKQSLIAKRDHVIFQNDYKLEIKEGDDLSKKDIPERFIPTLKAEKVI